MGKFSSKRFKDHTIKMHSSLRNAATMCFLLLSNSSMSWGQSNENTSLATEKEQIYMDMGFVIYPPKLPRNLDLEVQKQKTAEHQAQEAVSRSQKALTEAIEARIQAEQQIERLKEERVNYEVQAALALRDEQQRRMTAEAKAQQYLIDKEKAEAEFNAKLGQERQVRSKLQSEMQALIEQKNKLIQTHSNQLKSEESKRLEVMSQLKKQSTEETETEARLSRRLLAEEQARLELQSNIRQLESDKAKLQQELDKLKTERKSTILISPSGK